MIPNVSNIIAPNPNPVIALALHSTPVIRIALQVVQIVIIIQHVANIIAKNPAVTGHIIRLSLCAHLTVITTHHALTALIARNTIAIVVGNNNLLLNEFLDTVSV